MQKGKEEEDEKNKNNEIRTPTFRVEYSKKNVLYVDRRCVYDDQEE